MEILDRLRRLQIETPSWGYGNSGTRFHVYPWPGAARNVHERIADAALVHQLTGCCPSVALHIPWDEVDDYAALRSEAEAQGLASAASTRTPSTTIATSSAACAIRTRRCARSRSSTAAECVEVAKETGSPLISLWLADGTNYPGQDNLRARYRRLVDGLEQLYAMLPPDLSLLVEYKFFEPGFYSTDLPDWGTAALMCRKLGPQAKVLVDLGHHPQGTNVEQIVGMLLEEDLLGGFHFNNRKYADDDLVVGAIDPFELFRIMHEIAQHEELGEIAFMIDQSHNVEGKVDAMIQSVMNVQTAYAKALLVDAERLDARQREGDVLGAHRVLLEAFESDVRPLLAELRAELGVAADPVEAFRTGGHGERLAQERGIVTATSAYEA